MAISVWWILVAAMGETFIEALSACLDMNFDANTDLLDQPSAGEQGHGHRRQPAAQAKAVDDVADAILARPEHRWILPAEN